MGSYQKKGYLVSPPVCAFLPLTDQITDLLIDMTDRPKGPSTHQFNRLCALSAQAHDGVATGALSVSRRVSRIWDAPVPERPRSGEAFESSYLGAISSRALLYRGRVPARHASYHS